MGFIPHSLLYCITFILYPLSGPLMAKNRKNELEDKVVYLYHLSTPSKEETLVTDTHQNVLYRAGTVYFKPSYQLVPWTTGKMRKEKRTKNESDRQEIYHPRAHVWVVPVEPRQEWMYPTFGKPGALVKGSYAVPQNIYDLFVKEYQRMKEVHFKIEEERRKNPMPTIRGPFPSFLTLPPPPPVPSPAPDFVIPLEQKVKKR